MKAPAGLMKAPSKESQPKNGERANKVSKAAKADKAAARASTPQTSSATTAATSAVAPSGGSGLTPERQRRRRRRQVNRQSELRYVLPMGLIYSTKKGDLDPKYRVLAKTHHVYTVTESRENLAREAFERLCREMGANAALNVTTRELAETYNHKVYRRFEIKGIPAIVGEVSTVPGAMSRSLAIKAFPRPAAVRAYQQRAQEHQSAKGKIRSDEGFERMDRSVAQQVLFAIFVILALLATAAYIPW